MVTRADRGMKAEVARRGDPQRLRPVLLCSAILLLVAAGGLSVRGCGAVPAALLIDASWSTGLSSVELEMIGRRTGLDPGTTSVWVFGEALVPVTPLKGGWPAIGPDVRRRAGPGATRLSNALDRVLEELPPGGRVVVATDGRLDETQIRPELHRLLERELSLEFHALGRRVATDYRIESIRLPSLVGVDTGVVADVSVRGPAGESCGVLLLVDGEEAASRRVELGPAGSSRFRLALPPLAPGFREVSVVLRDHAGDPQPLNDRLSAGVVVDGGRAALLVNAPELVAVLSAAGYRVVEGQPEDAGRGNEDLCILRDVPVSDLGDGGARMRSFVQAGGGLIVLGGLSSYGPGGYSGRPLSECLPVRCAPEGEGLQVTVLLDRSGTMGEGFSEEQGAEKLRAAQQAVRRLLAVLPDGTAFTLIPFAEEVNGRPERMLLSRGNRAAAIETVAAVAPAAGSTALIPPLAAARHYAPDEPDTKWLVLVVTDGQLVGESEDAVVAAARGLTRAGARVEALAVGQNADVALLSRLIGTERQVRIVTSSGDFERSFLDALLELEGEGRVLEGEFEVRRGSAVGDLATLALGRVRGLVRTWGRESAEILVETTDGYPLVARWRYGLGRTIAVTTDPLGAWADQWPAFELLEMLAAKATRPAELGAPRVQVAAGRGGFQVSLFSPHIAAGMEGMVDLPDGTRRPLRFRPCDPGRSVAALGTDAPPGAARLSVALGESVAICGLSIPYPVEYGETGPDVAGMAALTALRAAPAGGSGETGLGPYLAGAALVLLILDRVLLALGAGPGLKGRTLPRR